MKWFTVVKIRKIAEFGNIAGMLRGATLCDTRLGERERERDLGPGNRLEIMEIGAEISHLHYSACVNDTLNLSAH